MQGISNYIINFYHEFKVYIISILISLIVIIGGYYSYHLYKDLKLSHEIINTIDTLSTDKPLLYSIYIDKNFYEFAYDNKQSIGHLFLNNNDKNTNYYFQNKNWFIDIPKYYITDNNNYKYIKLNQTDLDKNGLSNDVIKEYHIWLNKSILNFISAFVRSEVNTSNTFKDKGVYKVTIVPSSRVNFKSFINKAIDNNEKENNLENLKKSLMDIVQKWNNDSDIENITAEFKNNEIKLDINYHIKNERHTIQSFITTNVQSLNIDANENNILNINQIKK